MKPIRHIINLLFGFALCFVLTFKVGPQLYQEAKDLDKNPPIKHKINHFSLNYVFNSENYVQLNIVTHKVDSLSQNYYVPDGKHKKIIEFLRSKGTIKNESLAKILPLSLDKKQLKDLNDVELKFDGKTLQVLVMDGNYLIGNEPTIFKKGMYYLMSGIAVLLGVAGLILLILVLIRYHSTGELPDLPNKINGLKYFLRVPNSK